MHALPIQKVIDVEITQVLQRQLGGEAAATAVTHTWTAYKFGNFSNWVSVFKPGSGSITIWENNEGVRGKQLYHLDHIPLTPGPLIVALKIAQDQDPSNPSTFYPPNQADQVETIAASYPPFNDHASVRLFNLVADAKLAGMSSSGAGSSVASDVHFGLSSEWLKFPVGEQTFEFFDDDSLPPTKLAEADESLVGPPVGSTQFLLGLRHAPAPELAVTAKLLKDAPEDGVCKPELQGHSNILKTDDDSSLMKHFVAQLQTMASR